MAKQRLENTYARCVEKVLALASAIHEYDRQLKWRHALRLALVKSAGHLSKQRQRVFRCAMRRYMRDANTALAENEPLYTDEAITLVCEMIHSDEVFGALETFEAYESSVIKELESACAASN